MSSLQLDATIKVKQSKTNCTKFICPLGLPFPGNASMKAWFLYGIHLIFVCTGKRMGKFHKINFIENVQRKDTGNEVATHRIVKSDRFHLLIADTKTDVRS